VPIFYITKDKLKIKGAAILRKYNQRKLLLLLAVVIWMAIIFKLSAQPGEQSNLLSSRVTGVIVAALRSVDPDASVAAFNHFIRKCAHFLVYMILGIVGLFVFSKLGYARKKGLLLTLMVCVGYAISDEVHQYFVPGRTPRITDVLIDSFGAVLGIGLYKKRVG
jgi:VanZ family protein